MLQQRTGQHKYSTPKGKETVISVLIIANRNECTLVKPGEGKSDNICSDILSLRNVFAHKIQIGLHTINCFIHTVDNTVQQWITILKQYSLVIKMYGQ